MAPPLTDHHRWTFRLALLRTWEILRDEGLRTFWFKLLGETVYRRLVLLENSLREPIPEVTVRVPIVVGRLEQAGMTEYLEFRPGTEASEIQRRLEDGHVCFTARRQACLVAVSWVATHRAWQRYLSCEIRLAPDEVYIYDSFTGPDCRGQGISSALEGEILRHFCAAGYRRVLRVISPENRASLRAAAKAGCRPCGVMGYVKIGPWRRHFYREN